MPITIPDSLEILKPILQNTKVAITIADKDGKLTLFNKAAEKLTGYSGEEVLGQPITLFYENPDELIEMHTIVLKEGKLEDYETILVGKEGKRIPISILVTLLQDHLGKVIGTMGISVEISDRKSLEKDLWRAKLRADFYNDLMCHDIRNFTQVSLGFLGLMLDGELGPLNPKQDRSLRICYRQILRTRDLIDRLRILASLTTGPRADRLESISLGPVIQRAIKAVEDHYSERAANIAFEGQQEWHVMASPLLFELIFNLLSNSVAHNTRAQPQVWVSVERGQALDELSWRILVRDDGPGIADDRKERVFERFTLLETRGSGIGLSLVRALVNLFDGKVWVEDRVLGSVEGGACFVVELREGPS